MQNIQLTTPCLVKWGLRNNLDIYFARYSFFLLFTISLQLFTTAPLADFDMPNLTQLQ